MLPESKTLSLSEKEGTIYASFPSFEQTGLVRHLFSTRVGGYSHSPYDLNLGISGKDDPAHVRSNYDKIARILGITADDFVLSAQIHDIHLLRVGSADRGKGVTRPREITGIDGLSTNEPGIALVTIHADCVPVYFLDPVHQAIGLAHAGWRGTVRKIAAEMAAHMAREYGTCPSDLLCGIGPSIGPDHFEVRSDVSAAFREAFGEESTFLIRKKDEEHDLIDLWKANVLTLEHAGVPSDHITVTDLCTYSCPELFHSYRRDADPGRMGAVLMLCPQGGEC